jgi:23S rRNA (guanosine2251-2'-O)-methyltransferase
MALGLVMGSEGEGMRRLVRETCDLLMSLPMRGHVASLNVATAGAVALYAAYQARGYK